MIIPIISIILPVYNQNEYIKDCLDSIKIPKGLSYEILIYNDGGNIIQFKNKIKNYLNNKNIKIFYSKKNQGIAFALNFLLKKSKGIYIMRIDADDLFFKNRIINQIKFISEKKLYSISSGSYFLIDINNNVLKKTKKYFSKLFNIEFNFHNPMVHPGIIGSSAIFKKFNYSLNKNSQYIEDYKLFYKLANLNFHFFNQRQNLIYYRYSRKDEKYKNIVKNNLDKFHNVKINRYKIIDMILYKLYKIFFIFFYFFKDKKTSYFERKKNLISVIIPFHNNQDTIERCVKSILNQSYKNFEILLINDDSNDNSLKIIKNIKSKKIKFYNCYNTSNPGLLRNILIDAAKGEYIAFLDSDDSWHKDKLKKQFNFMKKKKIRFSASNYKLIKNNKIRENMNYWDSDEINYKDLIKNNYFSTSTVMLKKDLFKEHEKFNVNRKGHPEDYELWLRILSKNKAGYIRKPLTIYKDSPNTSVRKFSKPGYLQFMLILYSQSIYNIKNLKLLNLFYLYFNFLQRCYYILKKMF